MSDIYCAKCGEPWDAYGVRHGEDMTPEEAGRFLAGEGCPCCRFGRTANTNEELELRAAQSELEASDEDPMTILERRGLL